MYTIECVVRDLLCNSSLGLLKSTYKFLIPTCNLVCNLLAPVLVFFDLVNTFLEKSDQTVSFQNKIFIYLVV